MLPNILYRINASPSIKREVEFDFKFLYIVVEMMTKILKKVMLSHSKDNVATAKSPIKAGSFLPFPKGKKIKAREGIPFGHKIALQRIPKGGPVIKYGERIGRAIRAIEPGELVHIHNVEGERGKSKPVASN